MIDVGITGQSGFVGTHLYETLLSQKGKYNVIPFEDAFFEDERGLRNFIRQCDVVVHLAAMMRSPIEGEVYRTNMGLIHQVLNAMEAEQVTPSILFASSIQENNGSEYGRCKLEGRRLLAEWAKKHDTGYGGMILPNLFGPGARPNSHSFIATFCYQLTHDEEPKVLVDNSVSLKYIDRVIACMIPIVDDVYVNHSISDIVFESDYQMKVTEILKILDKFKEAEGKGKIPGLIGQVEKDLYTTYESYKKYML